MGWYTISVLESLPVTLILGTVLGFLAGIGVGGGSLLMLWLTLVLDIPQPEARLINLLFFVPSALIACLFRRKQGLLDLRAVIPGIAAGCLCAGIASWLGPMLDTALLKKIFAGLLIFTGIREVMYKPKKAP